MKRQWGGKKWSAEEDQILVENYPSHGSLWGGWKAILPDRTSKSISKRAQKLGVRYKAGIIRSNSACMQIIYLMDEGKTPSEIDELMGWEAGTARKKVVMIWDGCYDQKVGEK